MSAIKLANFVENWMTLDELAFLGDRHFEAQLGSFGTVLNEQVELSQFFLTKISPFADGEIKLDVHDSNSFELCDLVAQVRTHATDLPI
jgi:hypothetical protein